jgi:hypothetical protein
VRTTLDLDDDILQAAKELADLRGSTAGRVLSELARRGLRSAQVPDVNIRNGVPLLPRQPSGSRKMTTGRVNDLRDA